MKHCTDAEMFLTVQRFKFELCASFPKLESAPIDRIRFFAVFKEIKCYLSDIEI